MARHPTDVNTQDGRASTKGNPPPQVSLGEINRAAIPLTFDPSDYDPLMEWIGNRRLVLIGEASHGTHDFYRERASITRRLIEEKGSMP
jgi:hypothetical protein